MLVLSPITRSQKLPRGLTSNRFGERNDSLNTNYDGSATIIF